MVGVPDTIRRRRLPERGVFRQVEGLGERECGCEKTQSAADLVLTQIAVFHFSYS